MFFLQRKIGLMLEASQPLHDRRHCILESRIIRADSAPCTVSHPPETVVECSREDAAIGVVPTNDTGRPTQALGIGGERGMGVEGLPILLTGQSNHGFSIQIAADAVDDMAEKERGQNMLGVTARRL